MKTLLNYTHQSFLMLWDIIYHILDSAIEDKVMKEGYVFSLSFFVFRSVSQDYENELKRNETWNLAQNSLLSLFWRVTTRC